MSCSNTPRLYSLKEPVRSLTWGCSSSCANKLAPRLVNLRTKSQPYTPPPALYLVPVTTSHPDAFWLASMAGMYFGCNSTTKLRHSFCGRFNCSSLQLRTGAGMLTLCNHEHTRTFLMSAICYVQPSNAGMHRWQHSPYPSFSGVCVTRTYLDLAVSVHSRTALETIQHGRMPANQYCHQSVLWWTFSLLVMACS